MSYIKFPFDRDDIKKELGNHILDKMESYNEQGYDIEKAEELSINDMGNAKEIGIELNKQHNPIIGWVWKITNVLVVLSLIFTLFGVVLPLSGLLLGPGLSDNISESDIVYEVDVDERVKIDDRVINIKGYDSDDNIIFEQL